MVIKNEQIHHYPQITLIPLAPYIIVLYDD